MKKETIELTLNDQNRLFCQMFDCIDTFLCDARYKDNELFQQDIVVNTVDITINTLCDHYVIRSDQFDEMIEQAKHRLELMKQCVDLLERERKNNG